MILDEKLFSQALRDDETDDETVTDCWILWFFCNLVEDYNSWQIDEQRITD